ncbi:alpha-ketoglutarate-dependent dioxygenase AlkB [Gillisia sp. M10.2A]|uniref:Alpha-ketoglutarate-dependent dioxygenase AlkB n=1 Tax=Gillisia lutea TaxID=2909668 RepID=A0ABS9EHS3_9FLAO|nr:alpha-ketoglutarate-dependent dioxygenase AlkB [Gillisia lutea]MCF4100996.1 alpha-ketoglutarate-dependent dioxygenase AlkB [Gillisia lutea]
MHLFEEHKEGIEIDLPDASLEYYPAFLSDDKANSYFDVFLRQLDWQQHDIKLFGKRIAQPRLTALYAINSKEYKYSNLSLKPQLFTRELEEINKSLFERFHLKFTHCLANLYRNEKDSMGWHADNEKELGPEPIIASLSLGAVRKFQLKHSFKKGLKHQLELEHGSLLLMKGTTQDYWKHQLPKTARPHSPRINLTFRNIL